MNENPEGTPNPLNPNPAPTGPAAAPAGSMGAPATPATPAMPATPAPTQPSVSATPVTPQPTQPVAQPVTNTIPVNRPAVGEPIKPTTQAQPMRPARPAMTPATPVVQEQPKPNEEPKGSVVEPAKKKSKTSLIIILVVFFIALIGAAVAALVVFDPFGWFNGSDDRVPTAISKLFSEGAPTNVKMSGSITLSNNNKDASVSTIDVTFISEANTVSKAQSANASITATFADESEFTFEADEVHAEGGDLYLKLNDIAGALEDYRNNMLESTTNCEVSDTDEVNCETTADETVGSSSLTMLEAMGIFETIDNQWVRISGNDFSTLSDVASVDSSAQCLIDAAGSLSTYNTDIAGAYKNNQFIEYSTENLTISKKKDNLYLLTINPSKFTNFVNSLSNSGFMNALYACTGAQASNGSISTNEVNQMLKSVPTIYVEVNDDNMFTRVYLKASSTDGNTSVIADISLSYPEKITITEPSEYIDLNTILTDLFSQFFGTEFVEVEVAE